MNSKKVKELFVFSIVAMMLMCILILILISILSSFFALEQLLAGQIKFSCMPCICALCCAFTTWFLVITSFDMLEKIEDKK